MLFKTRDRINKSLLKLNIIHKLNIQQCACCSLILGLFNRFFTAFMQLSGRIYVTAYSITVYTPLGSKTISNVILMNQTWLLVPSRPGFCRLWGDASAAAELRLFGCFRASPLVFSCAVRTEQRRWRGTWTGSAGWRWTWDGSGYRPTSARARSAGCCKVGEETLLDFYWNDEI